jgi:T5SS/PEP-CTERM-associated repeat protein
MSHDTEAEQKPGRFARFPRVLAGLVIGWTIVGSFDKPLRATVDWHVTIEDPGGVYTSLHDAIRDVTVAAGNDWSSNITGSGTVHVQIVLYPACDPNDPNCSEPLASTCPGTGMPAGCGAYFGDQVGTVNGISVWEVVPQKTIREGLAFDANRVDINVFIPSTSMDDLLWWDPEPLTRAAPVPSNKLDAYTAMLHELGHGLGFFGIRDVNTGALSGNEMTTFDQWVSFATGAPQFLGPAAMQWHGGPAPLESGGYEHLPEGVGAPYGERDYIRPLEVAFIDDMGYATRALETAWDVPAVGSWFNSANWTNGVPGSGTEVSIGPGGVAQVIQPGAWSYILHLGATNVEIADGGTLLNATNAYLGSSTEVTVTGIGSTWTNGRQLQVGSFGLGTLVIAGGASVFCGADGKFGDDELVAAILGNTSAARGEVTVTGFASTLDIIGELQVGGHGDGALTVADGATLLNLSDWGVIGAWAGSTGTVLVTGEDSIWNNGSLLVVAHEGVATLTIEAGGRVFAIDHTVIGGLTGSNGAALVTGLGSELNSGGQLVIGYDGTGRLTIADVGDASSTEGLVGLAADATGTVTVTGGASWTINERIAVGENGSGTLNIEDGGIVDNGNATVGGGVGSNGAVNVTGDNSTWNNRGNLSVGYSGSGQMQVEAGGQIFSAIAAIGHNADSMGSASVGDEDSRWTSNELQVGSAGNGALTIDAAGNVSTMLATIGTFASGTGIVTVMGSGATWSNSGQLSVGSQGNGSLFIESGGNVSSATGFIGTFSNSHGEATVTGAGSTWTNDQYLIVGYSGEGSLRVEAGGSVSEPQAFIGYTAGSVGNVTVVGAGSTWSGASLIEVGRQGSGMLTIEAGGKVNSPFGFIGSMTGSTGAVTVTGNGSEWRATGSLFVGGSSSQAGGNGALTVRDGGRVFANTVHIWSSGTLGGDGTVQSNVINGGRVRPGNSPGVLNIVGNYTQQVGGTLEIELGGTIPASQYDSLAVTGAVNVGGTLLVSLINNFIPAAGDSFQILTATAGLTGTFASEMLPDLADNLTWHISYNTNSVLIGVGLSGGLPGDYNRDGTVDAADYVVWRNNEGTTNLLPNDLLGGIIDSRQYNQWRANFGATTAGAAAVASADSLSAVVPEPACNLLLLVGLIGLIWCVHARVSPPR